MEQNEGIRASSEEREENDESFDTSGGSGPNLKPRKQAYHFKTCDDIKLLKEVTCCMPYNAPTKKVTECWNKVAKNTGDRYSGDSARKRFQFLMASHKNNELVSKRRSGTEEEYNEREQLLTDLSEEIESARLLKSESKNKKLTEVDKDKADKLRDAAMKALVKKTDPEEPKFKKTKPSVLELMTEDLKLKERQLALDERRLTLQENEQKVLAEERRQAAEERKIMMSYLLDNLKK